MTLHELIERLSKNDIVDGMATIGSTGEGILDATSDYDVLIVLTKMPLPLKGGVIYLDGRLTDIVFATTNEINRLSDTSQDSVVMNSFEGKLAKWMTTAQVVIDRHGRLERLRHRAQSGLSTKPLSDGEVHSKRRHASYNVAQTRRILRSDDPTYLTAVDLRLLYQLADLMVDYFTIRDLPWDGEKAAVRYWVSHDPSYLELFKNCMAEKERARKADMYVELAEATMAPVGKLLQTGATWFWLDSESKNTPENMDRAFRFWESLIKETA